MPPSPALSPRAAIVIGLFVIAVGGVIALHALGLLAGPPPPGTPAWVRALQLALGLGMVAALGIIVGWVAFGPGRRTFSVTGTFGQGAASEIEGRVLFGAGAVLMALFFVALLVVGLRRLRGRR